MRYVSRWTDDCDINLTYLLQRNQIVYTALPCSSRGLFGSWTVRVVDCSGRGLFGSWTVRVVDCSSRGLNTSDKGDDAAGCGMYRVISRLTITGVDLSGHTSDILLLILTIRR